MPEREEKPIVTKEEVENIIKDLEGKESEKKKVLDLQRKGKEGKEKEQAETIKKAWALYKKKQMEAEKEKFFEKPKEEEKEIWEEPKKDRRYALNIFKFITIFFLILGIFYFSFNYKAITIYFSYLFKNILQKEKVAPSEAVAEGEINLPDSLIIDKIHLNLPITWQVEEKDFKTKLKEGVVHLKNSALPEQRGNIIIFGLSSNWPWYKGKYNQAFALLSFLEKDDEIVIVYKKKKYLYYVSDKKIVSSKETKIFTSPLSLNLITGWPLGMTLKRLVIISRPKSFNFLPELQE